MENFTRIEHEDGSIEYVSNIAVDPVIVEYPVPEDIALLSLNQLEEKILESHKNFIRQERDKKLLECDWTQSPDSPLTEQKRNEWKTYRQELRDIVNNIYNTDEILWPVKP